MKERTSRPFYHEYAWAYDSIIISPVERQCDFITGALAARGVSVGARLLDAGCGAGRYAVELARRGYEVHGLDLSPQLIAEARERARALALPISFAVGNILDLAATPQYDAILCRGVLNDLLDDASRQEVFFSFARALRRASGVLILDVREWDATTRRKTLEPVFERTVETPRGWLTFRSVTELEPETRRLRVKERHTLTNKGVECVSVYDFEMRCWTREELEEHLVRAGFERIEYFGGYDSAVAAGESDRLVSVASRG